MYKIQFTEPAEDDLLSIIRYIADVLKSPSAAKKLLNEIEEKVLMLKTSPFCNDLVSDDYLSQKGIRSMLVKNYHLFYRINDNDQNINIIRILYARRDWASLLSNIEL